MPSISNVVRPSIPGQPTQSVTAPKKFPATNLPATSMHCDVVFGSPSMDCNGTGICKITGTNSIRPIFLKKDCKRTLGQIAASPNNRVSLFFFREFLCIHLYQQHFRKGVLQVKETCPIPSEVSNTLGIKAKNLLPGNYTVVQCDGYYRVDIDCL